MQRKRCMRVGNGRAQTATPRAGEARGASSLVQLEALPWSGASLALLGARHRAAAEAAPGGMPAAGPAGGGAAPGRGNGGAGAPGASLSGDAEGASEGVAGRSLGLHEVCGRAGGEGGGQAGEGWSGAESARGPGADREPSGAAASAHGGNGGRSGAAAEGGSWRAVAPRRQGIGRMSGAQLPGWLRRGLRSGGGRGEDIDELGVTGAPTCIAVPQLTHEKGSSWLADLTTAVRGTRSPACMCSQILSRAWLSIAQREPVKACACRAWMRIHFGFSCPLPAHFLPPTAFPPKIPRSSACMPLPPAVACMSARGRDAGAWRVLDDYALCGWASRPRARGGRAGGGRPWDWAATLATLPDGSGCDWGLSVGRCARAARAPALATLGMLKSSRGGSAAAAFVSGGSARQAALQEDL